MTELVHLDVADGVATITLDSEHNRNALSRQLVTELRDHLASAEADADAKVIVLRSAHRVFCSGADLSEAAEGSMQQGAAALIDLQRRLATSAKPVVVVLGGPVRAGGLGLVGAADIVLATRPVTFALTEVRLALAPAVISLSLLPRLAPRAASDLFLTGRKFDAVEAAEIGLVTRVVEDGELESGLQAVLADLAQGYPQGFRETKALLNHDLVERIDRLGDQVAEQSARLFGSDEAREAMLAFLSRKG
ncbi:enoyl-CoA hydratase/isomerase family protein [Aeromicrobium senzhongii]|uniref:Enoyl-CoA hydratase/isomerase family protein n=1 Tax=Aeromicrobium senzhongii TaxID=2663859 RepID=A0ABX6ST82_9ACTN|nr:enoyl-CoA hydratase-related protein [Aeromicrobium senzhongii]MTB89633.1 enoyl-CoA hydratase [Aeromicrobium senzhongii]QNL94241.1 enoyl-CoA hydratase/isomerase family protein [Aeromicrobium senzhongii]